MFDLPVHLLRFRAEVTHPLRLPPAAGAALRGALFGALRAQFCAAGGGPACGQPAVAAQCPVCFLLAPVEAGGRRGQDVPRPYVLRLPPDAPLTYAPGQSLQFELLTFGRALGAFPYALLGVQEMGARGLGADRRGAFRLAEVWADNPLAGRQERVYRAADGTVTTPDLPITAADVAAEAATLATLPTAPTQPSALRTPHSSPHSALSPQRSSLHSVSLTQYSPQHSPLTTHHSSQHSAVRLTLHTPTRLVESGRLVKPAAFTVRTLVARLLERLDALGARYGTGPTGIAPAALLAQAARVHVAERRLAWHELARGSSRHGRALPMGGLVGSVVLAGDLPPLLPWLVWGTLVHVGKDAAMGNGRLSLDVVADLAPPDPLDVVADLAPRHPRGVP